MLGKQCRVGSGVTYEVGRTSRSVAMARLEGLWKVQYAALFCLLGEG